MLLLLNEYKKSTMEYVIEHQKESKEDKEIKGKQEWLENACISMNEKIFQLEVSFKHLHEEVEEVHMQFSLVCDLHTCCRSST